MTPLEAICRLGDDAPSVLLQTVFEKSSVGLGVVDRDFRFVWANSSLSYFYGFDVLSMPGTLVSDIVGADAWHARHLIFQDALRGVDVIDVILNQPWNSPRAESDAVKTSYYPLKSNHNVIGVLLVVLDHSSYTEQETTNRKQSEHEKLELIAKIRNFSVVQAAFFRDVLASVTDGKLRLCNTSAQLPPKGRPSSDEVALTASVGLSEIRKATKEAAVSRNFPDERWQDLVTAVSEAGMNAIVHAGGGNGQVFYCSTNSVQVWVTDNGKGIEIENLPRAALEKGYTTKGTMGHGMKLMLQTADRVFLLTGTAGTTVVLEQDREIQKRDWI